MQSAQELSRTINEYIRPATFPVSVRLVPEGGSLPEKAKRPLSHVGHKVALCQGVALCRRYGWTMCFSEEEQACPVSLVVLGFRPAEKMLEGTIAFPSYTASLEAGATMERSMALLPNGFFKHMVVTPLHKETQRPDLVLVYGNAAQIARLAQAANYKTGAGVACKTFARMACSAYIAKPIVEKECSLVVPSGGERVFALAQDDELIFAIPADKFAEIANGLEETHKQGLSRFPTPFFGLLAEPNFPTKYWDLVGKE